MDYSLLEELKDKLGGARLGAPAWVGLALVCAAVLFGALRLLPPPSPELSIETAAEAAAGEGDEPAEASPVFVHVSGAVASPGLVELPEGSRVADAIQAAGGLSEGADGSSVNLARPLADGEQVVVGLQASEAEGAPQAVADAPGKVSINSATAEQLEALPGIGPATAQKIVADRKANGPFASIDELTRVSGIGQKKYEALAGLITL